MQTKTLYRYTRPDGGTTVSPDMPPDGTPYAITYRLIADDGMGLTQDGAVFTMCVDTDTLDGWQEVFHDLDVSEDMQRLTELEAENADMSDALHEVGVKLE